MFATSLWKMSRNSYFMKAIAYVSSLEKCVVAQSCTIWSNFIEYKHDKHSSWNFDSFLFTKLCWRASSARSAGQSDGRLGVTTFPVTRQMSSFLGKTTPETLTEEMLGRSGFFDLQSLISDFSRHFSIFCYVYSCQYGHSCSAEIETAFSMAVSIENSSNSHQNDGAITGELLLILETIRMLWRRLRTHSLMHSLPKVIEFTNI